VLFHTLAASFRKERKTEEEGKGGCSMTSPLTGLVIVKTSSIVHNTLSITRMTKNVSNNNAVK